MLRSLKDLMKYHIAATDGEIGYVHDLLFDDCKWIVRYFDVMAGNWMTGRRVLISPVCVCDARWKDRKLQVDLTKEQVKNSPGIDADKPVSRQSEEKIAAHYSWPVYWGGAAYMTPQVPVTHPKPVIETEKTTIAEKADKKDPCLRSVREVTGYHIKATDDTVGHVVDFIVDDCCWIIRYMAVDAGIRMPGKKTLISPEWIKEINWAESKVHIDMDGEMIENSPEYNPSDPVNRVVEENLYDYYGRPRYWD